MAPPTDRAFMYRRALLLVVMLAASCSGSPGTAAGDSAPDTTAVTTPSTTGPDRATTTIATSTTVPEPSTWAVDVGVLWQVTPLSEFGMPATSSLRSLADVVAVEGRIVAGGRDGGEPMIILSDDAGSTWRRAEVETPGWAEQSMIDAVAERDGVLVAVGLNASGCPAPTAPCDDFTGAVWRSMDRGETWSLVDAPTMSLAPESAIEDVAGGPDGFVAIGNVNGPAPHSSLLWTSADGSTWSEGIALPSSGDTLTRADRLIAGADTMVVTGEDVFCGEWFDNGFWALSAGFAVQARAWILAGDVFTSVDLAGTGIAQPAIPDCPSDGLLEDSGQYQSWFGDVGVHLGRPAIEVEPGGLALIERDGSLEMESVDLLDGEKIRFVAGSDSLLGVRDGERDMLRIRSWGGPDTTIQREGPPIPGGGRAGLVGAVAVDDGIVGVGATGAGVVEAVVWRSAPGQVGEEQELTCSPAPGADCRGVDLSDVDLSGRDLSHADFRHADLGGVDLSGSDLTGARFASADLGGVDLRGATLVGADLAGVTMHSLLDDVRLSGADFTGADLRGASIELTEPATFDGVLADDASFRVSGVVEGATFRDARLVRTYLTAPYDATEAVLVADFGGSTMEGAYISVDTSGSSFDGVPGREVNFAPDAVCPDGEPPRVEIPGISRCTLGE